MPCTCAVADCKNNAKNTKGRDILYHVFPVANEDICKKWVLACKRVGKIIPKNARVCSKHFSETDYERDLEHELLGLPLRKKLKSSAIPSLFPNRSLAREPDPNRSNRALKRQQRVLANEILNGEHELPVIEKPTPPSIELTNNRATQTCLYLQNIEKRLKKAEARVIRQAGLIKTLRKNNSYLRSALQKEKSRHRSYRSCFSKQQAKKLNSKRVHWANEDVVKALSLRSISLKAYETARTIWKLPLPSPRTLRRRIAHFKCEPGIFKEVLQIMKVYGESLEPWQRVCCMSFDEMSICSKIAFDKSIDCLSSGSKVQVVMVRGLFDNWKQPVFFNMDTKLTKTILFEIISSVEVAGYPVVSITSDMGGDNVALWKELEITMENPHFQNPVTERNVHVFADVPHMLKLVRNHLLDDGILLKDGTTINKTTFENLLELDNAELKLCPKLNQRILELHYAERMRVKPAAQLLSNHTACLARKHLPNTTISNFIQDVNDAFDIMNSRVMFDQSAETKSAYSGKPQQIETLERFLETIDNGRFYSIRKDTGIAKLRSGHLPCQKGFIMSIRSTMNLFNDMKAQFSDVKYILTSRLNQDCLESLFSRIRAFGGSSTNPTSVEFRYRLRLILLGSQLRAPANTNSEYESDMNMISARLIEKNQFQSSATNVEICLPGKSFRIRKTNDNIDEDTLLYLAGYVAWKLKRCGKGVYGVPTEYKSTGNWIQQISRGGLLTPTNEMYKWILECNQLFNAFMNTNQGSKTGLLRSLKSYILGTSPHINPDAAEEFLKIRIKIRVNYLNTTAKKKISLINRNKAKQFSSSNLQQDKIGTKSLPDKENLVGLNPAPAKNNLETNHAQRKVKPLTPSNKTTSVPNFPRKRKQTNENIPLKKRRTK